MCGLRIENSYFVAKCQVYIRLLMSPIGLGQDVYYGIWGNCC